MSSAQVFVDFQVNRALLESDKKKVKEMYGDLRKEAEKKLNFKGFREGAMAAGALSRNVLIALGAAVGVAVTKFAQADRAASGLKSALAATNQEVNKSYKSLSDYAVSLSQVTVHSKDSIKEQMAFATNLGVTAENMDEVIKGGIGLAQAFGTDLRTGVERAALASQGQFRQLRMVIPALRDTKNDVKLLAIVNEKATAGFKQAKDYTHTFAGSLENLRKKSDEAQKTIGEAFAPELMKLGGFLGHVTDSIANMSEEQRANLVYWVKMAAGVAAGTYALSKLVAGVSTFGKIFNTVAGSLKWVAFTPAGRIVAAIVALGALFVEVFGKGTTFGEKFADVWGKIKTAAVDAAKWVSDKWDATIEGLVYGWYKVKDFWSGDADADFKKYIEEKQQAINDAATAKQKADAAEVESEKKAAEDKVKIVKSGHHREAGENEASHQDIQKTWMKINEELMKQGGESAAIAAQGEKKKTAAVEAEKKKAERIAARAAANTPAARAEALRQKAANVTALTGKGKEAYNEEELLKMLGYEGSPGMNQDDEKRRIREWGAGAAIDARSAGGNDNKRLDGTHQKTFQAYVAKSNALGAVLGSSAESPGARAGALIETDRALKMQRESIEAETPNMADRTTEQRKILERVDNAREKLRPMVDRARRIRALSQRADFAQTGVDRDKKGREVDPNSVAGSDADSIHNRLLMARDRLAQLQDQHAPEKAIESAQQAVNSLSAQEARNRTKGGAAPAAKGTPIEGLNRAADSITKAADKLGKLQTVGVVRDTGS